MQYELCEGVAILHLDDGKVNAVGHAFLDFVNQSLDRAETDNANAVVLEGRDGLFSAGFDLKEFQKGAESGIAMVTRGMELAIRLYGYPKPVVAACTGHAVAMGAFILLACDTRIGTEGEFRFALPETKINMAIPRVVQPMCAQRLSPAYYTRTVVQAEDYDAVQAVAAGFLDELVPAQELKDAAFQKAKQLGELPGEFYAANKMFMREDTLAAMQAQLEKIIADL